MIKVNKDNIKRSDKINQILLLMFLAIYNLQGTLYEAGGLFPKLILFIMMLLSAYYMFKTFLIKDSKPFFVKVWMFFIVLNSVGFLITTQPAMEDTFVMYKTILFCNLIFYPFYYWGHLGLIKINYFEILFYFILIVAINNFFCNQKQLLISTTTQNDVVNNVSYSFVFLIPYLFFIKRHVIIRLSLLVIIIFFVIQGAKRGALISGVTGFVIYIYYLYMTRKSIVFLNKIIILFSIFVISYLMVVEFVENQFLLSRLESLSGGNSSGRDVIYASIFNAWYCSDNFFNLLFGYGFSASRLMNPSHLNAHNDWLELLSNFGILGIGTYLFLFISIIKFYFKNRIDRENRFVLIAIIFNWLLISFYSMWYLSLDAVMQTLLLGYILGTNSVRVKS